MSANQGIELKNYNHLEIFDSSLITIDLRNAIMLWSANFQSKSNLI